MKRLLLYWEIMQRPLIIVFVIMERIMVVNEIYIF